LRYERNVKIKAVINKLFAINSVYFSYNKINHYIRDYFKTKKIAFIYKVIKKKEAFLLNEKEDLISLTFILLFFLRLKTNSEDSKN